MDIIKDSTISPLWLLDPELFNKSESDYFKEKERERRREERRQQRRREKQKQREKLRNQFRESSTTETTTTYDTGRSLRSQKLFFDLAGDLARQEKERMQNGEPKPKVDGLLQAPVWGSQSTESPREVFNCLCNTCQQVDTCQSDYLCTVVTHKESDMHYTTYGCLNYNQAFMEIAYCEGGREGNSDKTNMRTYCCTGELCNNVTAPSIPSTTTPQHKASSGSAYVHPAVFMVVPAVLCIILLMLVLLFIYKRMQLVQRREREKNRLKNYLEDNLSAQPLTSDDCSIELPDPTSGSGSGMPMLVQRTVAKSITLLEQIGTGKYGNVYHGLYQGGSVAVKVFLSKDVDSWSRENEMYTTHPLRHENILGFLASDMISYESVTQFWLITHYHENGSLYDFLNKPYNIMTPSQMMVMLYTAASGLVHLHTEIFGTQAKPAIAHRDIKSKNILVKADGSCCIADLGLSVTHQSEGNLLDLGNSRKVGTKRYMAPEVLAETMAINDFESFKRADIYSFSLVMWETARCALRNGQAEIYKTPYMAMVKADPTFEEMKSVVVTQEKRPPIPSGWHKDKLFQGMTKLIEECWCKKPEARLTVLRLKKSLGYLLEEAKDGKEYV